MHRKCIYSIGMKLSLYSDYALRVMMHLATNTEGLTSVAEIASLYGVSQNHLMKIVQDLGRSGFIETFRGRNGGIRLARAADDISLAALVRHTEGDCALVDCSACIIVPACKLPPILARAMQAFYGVLDEYTLGDLVSRPGDFTELFTASAALRKI